jgi:phage shock protein C
MDSSTGRRIRQIRINRGYSQEALAYLCKLNLRTIQRIESGHVKPRGYTLRTIEKVMDCKIYLAHETNWLKKSIQMLAEKINLIFRGEIDMKKENFLQQLSKSKQDKKIIGICGGLGEYSNVPSWLWRVLFLFFTFIYGIGLIVYVLLWIFMPVAKEMKAQKGAEKDNWLHQFVKSENDKKLGGICGGLGECTSIPSWSWRVLFVCAILIYGLGIALYLLLWIFVPKAKTIKGDMSLACSQ